MNTTDADFPYASRATAALARRHPLARWSSGVRPVLAAHVGKVARGEASDRGVELRVVASASFLDADEGTALHLRLGAHLFERRHRLGAVVPELASLRLDEEIGVLVRPVASLTE